MKGTAAPRIALRPIEPRDAEHVFALNSDAEVLRYVNDEPFATIEAASQWISRIDRELPLGIGRWSIVTHEGEWVGRCSLRRQPDGDVLMGYRLLRAHWGKGCASAAVQLMLRLAFQTHDLDQVFSRVARENIASRRVAERNGGLLWKEGPCGRHADALVYRFSRLGPDQA